MKCSPFLLKGYVYHSVERRVTSSLRATSEPKPPLAIRRVGAQRWKPREDKYKAQEKELNGKGMELQEEERSPSDDAEGGEKENKSSSNGYLDDEIGSARERQARTPWQREGPESPPVRKLRSAGAMTKGKLLTTPSRLLKLILPLTTLDKNSDRKDIEPLALLVHPQQPLSYLGRLIQSELPMLKNKDGQDKIPKVWFRAEDSAQEEESEDGKHDSHKVDDIQAGVEEGIDEHMVDGKLVKTGKISKDDLEDSFHGENIAKSLRGGPGEGGIETYSGLGHDQPSAAEKKRKFVRWSTSTEIGDFIRDAARGKEFAIEIEGSREGDICVGVPSFADRTHYLRVRLRKLARRLDGMAKIKKECDDLAHRSAQRLAMGGFGILVAWWASIYHFTFQTDYGWDTMEPITYLAGLSTIMIGYLYFLWHNREVSYRSALHATVSHQQNRLYTVRGLDIGTWESLVEEANSLRKEVKKVAEEYDVEWNEMQDEASEIVHEALRKERRKKERARDDDEDKEDDDSEGKGSTKD
ncbi:hypothetical protein VC83_07405 [Pseudogymnoascus destructans]|uniref:Calcium uniporter protein, mitochondrial n=1 Tax=Pseudogymnoascus destructans TaxID=655981 RepID=A0A177A377_9PEZI|nr:uncharacterized protein VC83_07405 [Pseudogymnoascus destructans]OAF56040.1 hypothetical protein VC83_07405 [Pseudogymnoascus destructans]